MSVSLVTRQGTTGIPEHTDQHGPTEDHKENQMFSPSAGLGTLGFTNCHIEIVFTNLKQFVHKVDLRQTIIQETVDPE